MPSPHRDVVQQQQCKPRHRDQEVAIVAEQPYELLPVAGRLHVALRPANDDGQTVRSRQRFVGGELDFSVRATAATEVLRAGAVTTCVAINEQGFDRLAKSKPDRSPRGIDRKIPAIAGRVPIQLVVLIEEPNQTIGAIAKSVFVNAAGQKTVFVSKIDTNIAAGLARMKVLGLAVRRTDNGSTVILNSFPSRSS